MGFMFWLVVLSGTYTVTAGLFKLIDIIESGV